MDRYLARLPHPLARRPFDMFFGFSQDVLGDDLDGLTGEELNYYSGDGSGSSETVQKGSAQYVCSNGPSQAFSATCADWYGKDGEQGFDCASASDPTKTAQDESGFLWYNEHAEVMWQFAPEQVRRRATAHDRNSDSFDAIGRRRHTLGHHRRRLAEHCNPSSQAHERINCDVCESSVTDACSTRRACTPGADQDQACRGVRGLRQVLLELPGAFDSQPPLHPGSWATDPPYGPPVDLGSKGGACIATISHDLRTTSPVYDLFSTIAFA